MQGFSPCAAAAKAAIPEATLRHDSSRALIQSAWPEPLLALSEQHWLSAHRKAPVLRYFNRLTESNRYGRVN